MRIKICGVTCAKDAAVAAALGADAIGLNFYSASPRSVDRARAGAILRALPPFVEPVGIFVNSALGEVLETIASVGRIRTIQWHGEDREACAGYGASFIPAFPVRDQESLAAIARYVKMAGERNHLPAAVLVDAHVRGQYGGTGQRAPWELLADFRPGVPLILAGGLTPENVADAIRIVRPYAVDVASGVESSPGKKDSEKMKRFIDAVRSTG